MLSACALCHALMCLKSCMLEASGGPDASCNRSVVPRILSLPHVCFSTLASRCWSRCRGWDTRMPRKHPTTSSAGMTDRRTFLQASAATVASAALPPIAPLGGEARGSRGAPRVGGRVVARPVPLNKVRLTGGPLQRAQQADIKYLLELEPDRMLAFYRTRAGLSPKGTPYGGWDGPGRNLTGHVAGHYLSAVSSMYAATGDARFKERADYLVRELATVQRKQGDGYLSALEGGREAFAALSRGEIRSTAFDLNGLWSPWYILHKTFAGLRDAHRRTGNRTALEVETRFAEWAGRVLAQLSAEHVAKMLNTEHGGMNEVLADLYVDTGDARWLALSRRFEHHAFTDALARHQDNLAGKHVNCQIPKLIGSAARYEYAGEAADLLTASFFWDRVAQHHSYATGGQGLDEYFGFPDRLTRRVDGRACESCSVYNMLKLTRRLFSFRPDAFFADFHERMLFNHALASFDPDGVRMSYMVPVGRAEQQEYQRMLEDFTCCMGTGMENHALHGEGIYYESHDTVWVNLFAPSTADLDNGARLTIATDFPDGEHATITWGPLVLAGDLGARREKPERTSGIVAPLLVTDRPIDEWVVPAPGRAGDFRATGVARRLAAPNDAASDLPLAPFYRTHGRTYSVYFDVLTAPGFEARVAERAAELAREQRLERATVAFVQPGADADEQRFHYHTDPTTRPVVRTGERTGRGGSGWFSFDLPVEASGEQALVVTYRNDLGLPVLANFAIQVDGTPIARYTANRSATGFWDATYPLPVSALAGKREITVRFVAGAESRIVTVYGIRIIRAKDVADERRPPG